MTLRLKAGNMGNDFFINEPEHLTSNPAQGHTPNYSGTGTHGVEGNGQGNSRRPSNDPRRSAQSRPVYTQGNPAGTGANTQEALPDDYFVGRNYSFEGELKPPKSDTSSHVIKIVFLIVFALVSLTIVGGAISIFRSVSNDFGQFSGWGWEESEFYEEEAYPFDPNEFVDDSFESDSYESVGVIGIFEGNLGSDPIDAQEIEDFAWENGFDSLAFERLYYSLEAPNGAESIAPRTVDVVVNTGLLEYDVDFFGFVNYMLEDHADAVKESPGMIEAIAVLQSASTADGISTLDIEKLKTAGLIDLAEGSEIADMLTYDEQWKEGLAHCLIFYTIGMEEQN